MQELENELLIKELSKIESSILKLIIADFCKDETGSQEIIEQLKTQKKNSLSNNLIIASWYGLNEKYTEAVKVLTNSRKFCSKKSEMKSLNAAIVYYAENSEDDKLKEEGKKAGEKLISLRLSIAEKGELASSLESMGYRELANNLDKEIDKATNRKTGSITSISSFINPRSQNTNPANKTRELLQQGKDKEALTYATQEFRKMAKAELTINRQNMGNSNSYNLKRLLRYIKEKGKAEEFIKNFEPSSEETFSRKLLERALAYELLKETAKAIEDYKAVLSKNDSNKIAHLRLAFLIAGDDLAAAKSHLLKATGSNINFVGPIIYSILSNMYNNPAVYDIYPIIASMLKDVEPKVNQQFYWLTNIIQQMENSFHGTDVRLPSFFDKNQSIHKSKNIAKAQKILKKRYETYLELTETAMRFHSTAATAFGKLDYLHSIGRVKDIDTFQLAKKCLKAMSINSLNTYFNQTIYANNIQVQIKSLNRYISNIYWPRISSIRNRNS